jgi:hypothetical protein
MTYGTAPSWRGGGLASRATRLAAQWVAKQPGVRAVGATSCSSHKALCRPQPTDMTFPGSAKTFSDRAATDYGSEGSGFESLGIPMAGTRPTSYSSGHTAKARIKAHYLSPPVLSVASGTGPGLAERRWPRLTAPTMTLMAVSRRSSPLCGTSRSTAPATPVTTSRAA